MAARNLLTFPFLILFLLPLWFIQAAHVFEQCPIGVDIFAVDNYVRALII